MGVVEDLRHYDVDDKREHVWDAVCPKCGFSVTKTKYGEDEECPNCGEWLEWDWDDEDEYSEMNDYELIYWQIEEELDAIREEEERWNK